MKILMLGWELPPHNSGGLGVACYHLAKALAQQGADIEFVVPYRADHAIDFMTVTSVSPQHVSEVIPGGTAYDSYLYVYNDGRREAVDIYSQQAHFEQAVADFGRRRSSYVSSFDVIHAHDWLTFRAALRLKQQTQLPLVLHVHSLERDRAGGEPGNPLVREIESMAFLMADQIVAVSQHTKDMIVADYDIPADKIEVVYNYIDTQTLAPLDPANAYHYLTAMKAQGYKVVVNVGRFAVQKNLVNLLYAAKEVIERFPKTLFLLVGGGEQYFELVHLAADLGIGRNVIFTEFQRGKNWRDSFAIADLFVMPSVSEPFGLTAFEAIFYGTPVLMSRQSGAVELIRNCLKVDFWDVKQMANKIAAVVQSPALGDELHTNAYSEMQKLSWSSSVDKLFKLYERPIATRTPRAHGVAA